MCRSKPWPGTGLSASRPRLARLAHPRSQYHRQLKGQAEKWIYPKIGAAKHKNLTATDAERFFNEIGKHLSKRSHVMIKSTMRRSIKRALKHDLIGRNVAELADLPDGQPGTSPSCGSARTTEPRPTPLPPQAN